MQIKKLGALQTTTKKEAKSKQIPLNDIKRSQTFLIFIKVPLPDTFSARAGGPKCHCGQSATDEKGMKVIHK